MSKVTMPEPDFHVIIRRIPRYLFSADQMEAYAAAKVREALEEAARLIESGITDASTLSALATRRNASEEVRSLIPSTPA